MHTTVRRTPLQVSLCIVACLMAGPAAAERGVEVPTLAAHGNSPQDPGAFSIGMLWWDQKPEPDPVVIQWGRGRVNSLEFGRIRQGRTSQRATMQAFRYAIYRTPSVHHSGTVNVQGIAYRSTTMDGPSAGATMAIGLIALFRGDSLLRGVALTGTLQEDGSIGKVGGIAGKIRAAAREGYHTILIPSGQLNDSRWELGGLALDLGVTIREVNTIDEAYLLLTGQSL